MVPIKEMITITLALFCIMTISILMGAVLPLGINSVGIDPAHSSTTIQVVMEIMGVIITVTVTSLILGSAVK
jgi:Mg/Co/Ni transporter MgtE